MKKIFFTIMTCVLCVAYGCGDKEDINEGAFYETYITSYYEPENAVPQNYGFGVKLEFTGGKSIYNGEKFKELSRYYGDVNYNRWRMQMPITAINDSITKVELITKDGFDVAHPAESDVAEFANCIYASFYDYIKNGYTKQNNSQNGFQQYADVNLAEYSSLDGAELLKEKLSDINKSNTKLIGPYFVLTFDKKPEKAGKHSFELVMHLSKKIIKVPFEYDF